jgi:hypothetical protein
MAKHTWLFGAALAALTFVSVATAQASPRSTLGRRDSRAAVSSLERGTTLQQRQVQAPAPKQREAQQREKGRNLSSSREAAHAGRTGALRARR